MKFTKETLRRMLRTFFQVAISYIAVNLALIDFSDSKEAIRSAVIGLVISAISSGLAAIMNLEHGEELGAGDKMTFTEFVNKYLGKGTDYDGTYGIQCVDLAKLYIDKVLGVKPKNIGNAHAYYDNFDETYISKYFKKIPYKKGVKAQKGDLVVWGLLYNGKSTNGHIAIATGVQDSNSITTYDQNWGGAQMKKVTHSLSGISGFLRPIEQENINPKKEDKPKQTVKYFSKCSSKYISLVDALESIGVNPTLSYRKRIAKANGIKNYIGTGKQNTKMLTLLKQGKLIKP